MPEGPEREAPTPTTEGRAKTGNNTSQNNAPDESKSHEEYLNEIRGWLVTVAALFVGMAFESAIEQPPAWMPKPEVWSLGLSLTHPRDRKLSPLEQKLAQRALLYLVLNLIMLSTALTLMTLLLVMHKSFAKHTMWYVRIFFPFLSVCAACSFAVGITTEGNAAIFVGLSMGLYAAIMVITFYWAESLTKKTMPSLLRSCVPRR